MFTNRKRAISLIFISVGMNTLLFLMSYYFNLPLWLDTTGTIYISCLLGFPAGFIVAIINSLFEAIFFYGKESLSFYFVSGVTAFLTSTVINRYKKHNVLKWMILAVLLIVVSGGVAVIITYIVNNGIPANSISCDIYYRLYDMGINFYLASALAVMLVKIPDIIVSLLLCFVAIMITPKKLKSTDIAIVVDER